MSNSLKEYFAKVQAAAANKRPVEIPAALSDSRATAEEKAAAQSLYIERLLAKSAANYSKEEKEYLCLHLAEYYADSDQS